jgi:futalosine hydrolase
MTYHLIKTFHSFSYDLAINIGVAESFDHFLEQGFVVNVVQEQFADLGFEDKSTFYTLAEKELQDEDAFPFTDNILHSLGNFEIEEVDALIPVKGITVNKLHGNLDSIEKIKEKFNPEIETFEGAAFFYTCLLEKIPFLEIRAISNFVEFRRIENWNKPKALKSLSKSVLAIFNELKID